MKYSIAFFLIGVTSASMPIRTRIGQIINPGVFKTLEIL